MNNKPNKDCIYILPNDKCEYQNQNEDCIGLPDCCVSETTPKYATHKELADALYLIRKCIWNSRQAPNILDTIDSIARSAISRHEGNKRV